MFLIMKKKNTFFYNKGDNNIQNNDNNNLQNRHNYQKIYPNLKEEITTIILQKKI